MRVSLNWLKEYVDISLNPEDLAHLLTMVGLEVEGLEAHGEGLEGIVVGRILSVGPHPGADRLSLCRVDVGGREQQIVCGAPNAAEGVFAPVALPGVRLPGGVKIKASKIRGEVSEGVLLAEDELGLTDDHTGIMELDPCEPGSRLVDVLPVVDHVLDISITPNRPDCACVIGVAREVAAALGAVVRKPMLRVGGEGCGIESLAQVDVLDAKGCPRYVAGMIRGVAVRKSPFWMRYRLLLCGMRAINNVVDVTNYVLLELGQPLHAFDYRRLGGRRIVVRRSREGELFTTLDGESRTLSSETLMICDGDGPVAIAGIMGGLNSEIVPETEEVLIESACFDPVTIRRGSKFLGLSTEASYRFERGTDIEGAPDALWRALGLMQDLGGGEVASGSLDVYPRPYQAPEIVLRVERTNRFLGSALTQECMAGYLQNLEMRVERIDDDRLRVLPPAFRVDVSREVDLMEEVARADGYDRIPVTVPHVRPCAERDAPEMSLAAEVRRIMVGYGFSEVITYSFVAPASAELLGAPEDSALRAFVPLLNPLTTEQSVLRTSLIPGLLGAVQTNVFQQERGLRLFEWGKIFTSKEGEPLPLERLRLSAVMTGPLREKTWYGDEAPVDFYDIKGVLEAFLRGFGLVSCRFSRGDAIPGFDPRVCAVVTCGDDMLGVLGRVDKRVMAALDIEREEAYLFDLDAEVLARIADRRRLFQPLAKFPAVYRDISMIFDSDVESARVLDIIRASGGKWVESVRIFDLYEGEKMPPGKKALAVRVCYRSHEKTLDGAAVNALHEKVIAAIGQETGGRLKEG